MKFECGFWRNFPELKCWNIWLWNLIMCSFRILMLGIVGSGILNYWICSSWIVEYCGICEYRNVNQWTINLLNLDVEIVICRIPNRWINYDVECWLEFKITGLFPGLSIDIVATERTLEDGIFWNLLNSEHSKLTIFDGNVDMKYLNVDSGQWLSSDNLDSLVISYFDLNKLWNLKIHLIVQISPECKFHELRFWL